MFKIKNAYESASRNDGIRILVDRLWPRGISKEKAEVIILSNVKNLKKSI